MAKSKGKWARARRNLERYGVIAYDWRTARDTARALAEKALRGRIALGMEAASRPVDPREFEPGSAAAAATSVTQTTKRRRRAPRVEVLTDARKTAWTEVLRDNHGATAKELARAAGCSEKTVTRSRFWKDLRRERKAKREDLDRRLRGGRALLRGEVDP
jgi:hypothetical protein